MKLFQPSSIFIEAVCNHPRVRPTLQRGTERLRAVGLPNDSVTLAFYGGVGLFLPIKPGHYAGHVAILPAYWGSKVGVTFGKAAITRLFAEYGADRLEVVTDPQLRSSREYCKRLGLKPDGRDLFQEYYSMEAQSWVAS